MGLFSRKKTDQEVLKEGEEKKKVAWHRRPASQSPHSSPFLLVFFFLLSTLYGE
jgi:hypothetical protein